MEWLDWLGLFITGCTGLMICLGAFYIKHAPEMELDTTHLVDAVENAEAVPPQDR